MDCAFLKENRKPWRANQPSQAPLRMVKKGARNRKHGPIREKVRPGQLPNVKKGTNNGTN